MTSTTLGGGAPSAAPAAVPVFTRRAALRIGAGAVVLIGLVLLAHVLQTTPERGTEAALSLLIGAALGIAFERGRFCFFCILRDFIEYRNSSSLYAILAALAIGGIGYAVLMSTFMPNPVSGRLPADAHIGPVSWVLLAAGVTFGLGMALSGACISGHLYRLGEGYSRAPLALLGSLGGFALGFLTWQTLYVETLSRAPVAWLPASLGYGGALIVHLAVLGGIALLLLRFVPALKPRDGGPLTAGYLWRVIALDRWNPLITGALVGLIGILAYFRVEPLGVTSQLGSLSRTVLEHQGLLGDRLPGLDGFAGCATVVTTTITNNGLLIFGLVLASFGVALIGGKFQLSKLTGRNSITALVGGVLMGWASMVALGCTVGTLLSGISAFAVSGWVFGAAVFGGVWLGIKLKLHTG